MKIPIDPLISHMRIAYEEGIRNQTEDYWRERIINECIAAVAALEPLLTQDKYNGGYDCCGCSTIDDLHSDSINALRALLEINK